MPHDFPPLPQDRIGNKLLAALPGEEYRHILPFLELTSFSFGETIYESSERPGYAYFSITSVASLTYTMKNGASAEMGMVGNEGLIGIALFTGGETRPNRAIAQHAGGAIRIGAIALREEFKRGGLFQRLLLAAPMGTFNNYRREPKAVLIVDRSLREKEPGEYSTLVKLPRSGKYDLAFLLDSPRVIHCFSAEAKLNPELEKKRQRAPLQVESLLTNKQMKVGEKLRLRFKLTDPVTNEPKVGLRDVRVLTFLAPGVWQKRQWAESVGDGVYESEITAPQAGVYYVFFECPSLKVSYVQLPHLVLQALDATPADKTTTNAGQNAQPSKNNR